MNKYVNGKIFKIVDVGYNKCYIRSTCESLSQRVRDMERVITYTQTTSNEVVFLFDEYGPENCEIF